MAHLPDRPDVDQLRTRARELQRGVRSGDRHALDRAGLSHPDTDFPLNAAHRVLAREHDFASWPRLIRHVETVVARTWHLDDDSNDSDGDRFLRLACLNYDTDDPHRWTQAERMLTDGIDASTDPAVAAVTGDVSRLRILLSDNPSAATEPTGPHGWAPLMYLAYSRVVTDRDRCLATAELLLDAGADVDDGRFFGGFPTPFTVLTGVFGGGENDQPPHPHAMALAGLLLDRGAEPNDGQTLYNRMFRTDDDVFEVLFDHGLGTGDGGPWRAALPDVLPAPTDLVGGLFAWALAHNQRDRVDMLIRRGVDTVAPLPDGRTPMDVVVAHGHAALAARLTAAGAAMPTLTPEQAFLAAVLAGDEAGVAATAASTIDTVRRDRPALMVRAAGQGRVAAVQLLMHSGFDIDALGRADIDVDQPWQTALHTAVERDDAAMVSLLIELGADPAIRDARFDATPRQWAQHLGHDDLIDLFDR